MPYQSDAQRRYMHARHPGIAGRWDQEIREKRKSQPSFGNGGKGHGRRQKDDVKKVDVSKGKKPFIGMKGTLESGERVSHGNKFPKYAKRKDFIGMKGTLENGDKVSRGRRMSKDVGKGFRLPRRGAKKVVERVKMPPAPDWSTPPVRAASAPLPPPKSIPESRAQYNVRTNRARHAEERVPTHHLYNTGVRPRHAPQGDPWAGGGRMTVRKSRFYDPESRRQRRLGMAEAALAGGSAAGLILGVRGAAKTTKLVRGKHPNVIGSPKEVAELKQRVGRAVSAKPRELALLGGGAASGGGAVAVRRHAESRRGHPYN